MTNLALNINESGTVRKRFKRCVKNTCSAKTVKKRLPIIQWLPKYQFVFLIQDIIAGITVGLTAIPQGIAYAVLAGLSPEYGLYAGIMGGFVYLVFGSCKDLCVGPTAILAAFVGKYVIQYSADFSILVTFLSGLVELICGVLHLGFLVEFISAPVITGFTTAAALQIAASQLKALFALDGSSGNYFSESVYNFVINIKSAKLWDPILGFSTIVMLIGLQRLGKGCNRTGNVGKQIRWFISLGRNAVVVMVGIIIAFVVKITIDEEPLALIGVIDGGVPKFALPPFTTTVGNDTYTFTGMLQVLGPQSLVIPFVAILESVAIAKAFSGGKTVDATQEMIAIGMCNIVSSFMRSMPITGSFTRTALNNAAGVQTPIGGVFRALLIISSLSLLTSTFYYIPKATLAGLIITAMYSMIDYTIFYRLWRTSKSELTALTVTIVVCLFYGLEYGILAGILIDACIVMFLTSRPTVEVSTVKCDNGELVLVPLSGNVSYCAAEHVRRAVLKMNCYVSTNAILVIDGTNLRRMDSTVAANLVSVVKDLDKNGRAIKFWNFRVDLKKMCTDILPNYDINFVVSSNVEDILDDVKKL